MSTTTQEQTPESSPQISAASAAAAKADKKKLKILKMALKDERATRSNVEHELKLAQEKIE